MAKVTSHIDEPVQEKKRFELVDDTLYVYCPKRTIEMEELNGLQTIWADKMATGNPSSIPWCRAVFMIRKIGDEVIPVPNDDLKFKSTAQKLKNSELDRCVEAYMLSFNGDEPTDERVKN